MNWTMSRMSSTTQSCPERRLSTRVRILGVDPGSRYTGYGILDCERQRNQLVVAGRLDVRKGELSDRLRSIFRGLQDVIAQHQPDEIAIEETFVNRVNAASALVLGQARGAAICACAESGCRVSEYAAAQVKLAIVGNGRADKQQVEHMVRVLLNTREPMTADASDALAVALTHAHVRATSDRAGAAVRQAWG